jgi:hypothetical protein
VAANVRRSGLMVITHEVHVKRDDPAHGASIAWDNRGGPQSAPPMQMRLGNDGSCGWLKSVCAFRLLLDEPVASMIPVSCFRQHSGFSLIALGREFRFLRHPMPIRCVTAPHAKWEPLGVKL